ncbi:MAG: hypothetical protein WC570_00475 [Patescibacteria group bacterium]
MSQPKKKKKQRIIRPKATFCGLVVWSALGILLIPLVLITLLATLRLFTQVPIFSRAMLSMLMGVLIYALIHFFVYQSTVFYVLAHEFTHAIFAIFSGAQVKKIKVASRGGWVELTQSNFIIDLAPYFFPLYSILLAVLYFIANRFWDLTGYYFLFFFLLGASLCFHYLSNWEILKIEQPDMKITGKIFGIIFVLLANLLFLNIIIMFVFLDYVNLATLVDNFRDAYRVINIF